MNNPMFQSATRVVLLMLVVALVSMTSYGSVFFQDDRFSMVFAVFKDVMLLVAGAFFMKSTSEQKPTVQSSDDASFERNTELLDKLSE